MSAYDRPYRWMILAGVSLSYLCFGLVASSLAPIVSDIVGELSLSHAEMGAVLSAWPMVYIIVAIPLGGLIDRIGVGRGFFLALGVMALSALARAVATDFPTLFLAVALFGLGGPLVSVGAPKAIGQWFDGAERGFAMGVYISGSALGMIAALALTNGPMMVLFDGRWRAVLAAYGGFVLLSGCLWLAIISRPELRKADLRSAATLHSRSHLHVFLALMKAPIVRILLAIGTGLFFFNHSLNNWLPEMLRMRGMTAEAAGYWASLPTVIGVLAALSIPPLARPERRFYVMMVLLVAAMSGVLLLYATSKVTLVIALLLQGIARGSLVTLTILILIDSPTVGRKNAGIVGGMFFTTAEVGAIVGPLTIGVLYDTSGNFISSVFVLALVTVAVMGLAIVARRHMISNYTPTP